MAKRKNYGSAPFNDLNLSVASDPRYQTSRIEVYNLKCRHSLIRLKQSIELDRIRRTPTEDSNK